MKVYLIFLLTLFALQAYGQDYYLKKKWFKYYHQNIEYNWKELGDVYSGIEESSYLYNSGRQKFRLASKISLGGLITGGVGLTTVLLGRKHIVRRHGYVAIGFGAFIELCAIVYFAKGRNELRMARRMFNFEMMKRFGFKSDISLVLGTTKNGTGLVMKF